MYGNDDAQAGNYRFALSASETIRATQGPTAAPGFTRSCAMACVSAHRELAGRLEERQALLTSLSHYTVRVDDLDIFQVMPEAGREPPGWLQGTAVIRRAAAGLLSRSICRRLPSVPPVVNLFFPNYRLGARPSLARPKLWRRGRRPRKRPTRITSAAFWRAWGRVLVRASNAASVALFGWLLVARIIKEAAPRNNGLAHPIPNQ